MAADPRQKTWPHYPQVLLTQSSLVPADPDQRHQQTEQTAITQHSPHLRPLAVEADHPKTSHQEMVAVVAVPAETPQALPQAEAQEQQTKGMPEDPETYLAHLTVGLVAEAALAQPVAMGPAQTAEMVETEFPRQLLVLPQLEVAEEEAEHLVEELLASAALVAAVTLAHQTAAMAQTVRLILAAVLVAAQVNRV